MTGQPGDVNVEIAVLKERIQNMSHQHTSFKTDIDSRLDKVDTRFATLTQEVKNVSDAVTKSTETMTAGLNDLKTELKVKVAEVDSGVKWSYKTAATFVAVIVGIFGIAKFGFDIVKMAIH